MKKTHTRFKRATAFLFFLLIAGFIHAQTCGSPIALTVNGCNNSVSTSDTVVWFSFNSGANAHTMYLNVTSPEGQPNQMSAVKLYTGSCGTLTLVETGINDHGMLILESAVSASTNYLVKVSRTSTASIQFNACLSVSASATPPCGACSITTCQLACNPTFDTWGSVPTGPSQVNNKCCFWKPVGTPEYFHSSSTSGSHVSIPSNAWGNETSHSGSTYTGAFMYYHNPNVLYPDPDFREYVQTQLGTTMTAGLTYKVSFWVSLSDYSGFAVNHIGVYFSTTQPLPVLPASIINVTPQISSPTIITTTNGWVQITGNYTPAVTGTYWATIGNFDADAVQGRSSVVPSGIDTSVTYPQFGAYYYIDDFTVEPQYPISFSYLPNPLCKSGNTVSITANSPLSNGTYTWSAPVGTNWSCSGAGCPTINVTSPINYAATYTVSTYMPTYGCTSTATVSPTWLASPLTVSAGADQSICLGGSATLSGTATGTFTTTSWSILNSATLCTGCTSTTVTPTSTTSYVYTVTNSSTGCTLKDTVKVTVTPLAVSIVSPPGASMCGGCFGFTTIPSGVSYLWSTSATSSSCASCATFSACWNGHPYDTLNSPVVVSVSIVDANGCQGSALTNVPTCCPFKEGQEGSYANILNETVGHVDSVSFPSLFSINAGYYESVGGQFSVNGVWTINKHTRLKGCEVKLGPNAKIVVNPGIVFELTNSGSTTTKLYACSDMWDGIYVDGTNTNSLVNVLNGTVIEDAKNAIVSTNGGKFVIWGTTNLPCKFNKNNIGVYIKAYAGTHPGVIRYAIFACDAPGQPGSTGGITFAGTTCRAPVSGKGLAGVFIEDCNAVTIGDSTSSTYRNLFERTQFGVYSKGSNVKVWNNDFKYFTTTILNKNLPPNGVAVFMSAGKFTPKTGTVGRVGNYKAKNKFTKCNYGVYAYNYVNLNCEYNRFDTCQTAGITTMNCQSRTILINADTLTECTGTNIQCIQSTSSTIRITYNSINNSQNYVPGNFGNTGIYVVQAALTPVNLFIQYNSIKKMRNGIWVSRVDKCKITDNTPINFMTGQPMSQLVPCIGIKLEEVTNSMIRQNGVSMQSSPTQAVHDEIFGIHMTNCKNDTVTKNTVQRMGSGVFLKGTNNPCILACNNMTTCWFGVNFNYLNGYGVGVSINDQIAWTSAGTPYSTGNAWSTAAGGEDITGRILPVSGNGIKWYYTTYNPDVSSMFFNSLFNNATVYTGNGDRCTFMLAPPAQTQEGIRNYSLAGICKTPRTYDTLNSQFQYHDKVFAYRMLRQNPSWKSLGTADDSYYSGFYTTPSSTNIGKFADVEDSISSGQVNGAITLLNSITPSGQYETNRKAVLDVYLHTWAIDSMNLDSTQKAILTAIINQGMLTGGTAVFDARNMMMLEVHDSSSVRMQQYSTPFADAPSISPAFPNPSNGSVSIKLEIADGQTGTFELIDLTGRLVGTWKFVGGQGLYTFDASYLPTGTYIYCIRSQGEMLKSDRLVIIRE